MKFLELIFALLENFVPLPTGRLAELRVQAENWEVREKKDPESRFTKAFEYNDLWYVQIALAILYLVGMKSIASWLMSNDEPEIMEEGEEQGTPRFGQNLGFRRH